MQAVNITTFENCERLCFSCSLKEYNGFHCMLYEQMFSLNFNSILTPR